MHGKEHIIELGKLLRAEHERGYDDGATTSGLEEFLADWRARANGALSYPEVQSTLALLNGYADFDDLNRRTRVDIALDKLRTLVRQGAGAGSQESGARSQELGARSQEPGARSQTPAVRRAHRQNPKPKTQNPKPPSPFSR